MSNSALMFVVAAAVLSFVKSFDSGLTYAVIQFKIIRVGSSLTPLSGTKRPFLRTGDKRFGGWSC